MGVCVGMCVGSVVLVRLSWYSRVYVCVVG